MDTASYLNLDILFHRNGDAYSVRARNSIGSESSRSQSFTIPFTPQAQELLTGDLPDAAELALMPWEYPYDVTTAT